MPRLKFIQSENDVKALVKKWFDQRCAWHFAPIQRGMGEHGIPDRIGCVPIKITPEMVGQTVGLFVAVEAKKPGRRGENLGGATHLQANNLADINEACGVGALVDGAHDLDVLGAILSALAGGQAIGQQILRRRLGANG